MPAAPKWDPTTRRRKTLPPVRLPAEGRSGPLPPWPLAGRFLAAERDVWAQVWSTPQAVAWERQRIHRVVARYCRVAVRAERPDSSGALLEATTALEDRLGLTPKAMRMLLWEVVEDEVSERRSAASVSPRARIRPVSTSKEEES